MKSSKMNYTMDNFAWNLLTFISLHTWALLQSSRHSHVVNRTWELTDVPPEYVRYYGVQFDPDFLSGTGTTSASTTGWSSPSRYPTSTLAPAA